MLDGSQVVAEGSPLDARPGRAGTPGPRPSLNVSRTEREDPLRSRRHVVVKKNSPKNFSRPSTTLRSPSRAPLFRYFSRKGNRLSLGMRSRAARRRAMRRSVRSMAFSTASIPHRPRRRPSPRSSGPNRSLASAARAANSAANTRPFVANLLAGARLNFGPPSDRSG
jgi:hypothetical protein